MMERVFSLAEERVLEAVRRRREAIAELAREGAGEVRVEGDQVIVRATGLRRRWLESSALRSLGL